VCCGVSNKGAAIYNGRIYRTTLDAHLMALDAKTGKEIWKSKVAEWKDGRLTQYPETTGRFVWRLFEDRENTMWVSAGAALLNLRVAVRAHGRDARARNPAGPRPLLRRGRVGGERVGDGHRR